MGTIGIAPRLFSVFVSLALVCGVGVVGGRSVGRAWAQCGPVWETWGLRSNGNVQHLTTWDPDGDGPRPEQLVMAGSTLRASGAFGPSVSSWDGLRWNAIAQPMSSVGRVLSWDRDGEGPLPPVLVASGTVENSDTSGVLLLSGAGWEVASGGMRVSSAAMTTWDPDGDGPLGTELVMCGLIGPIGEPMQQRVARWNGSAWTSIGVPFTNGAFRDVIAWDHDGDANTPEQLVVCGTFILPGESPANRIALWDGESWRAMGQGMNGIVTSLTTWDPDGPGPAPTQLIALGGFSTAGGVPAARLASWNGSAWSRLIAEPRTNEGVFSLVRAWDPDGDGPRTPLLLVGGSFVSIAGQPARRIAAYDGASWSPLGEGLSSDCTTIAEWDPDGIGPMRPRLFANGESWDGERWVLLGSESAPRVTPTTLGQWDPDGPGPQPTSLLVAGGFIQTETACSRWDGERWQAVGWHLFGTPFSSLTSWDPDGDGPLPARLVAGLSESAWPEGPHGVVQYNGADRWNALNPDDVWGSGLQRSVSSVLSWDPDGAGPQPQQLVAVGSFDSNREGVWIQGIASWNGTRWTRLGEARLNQSRWWRLTTWDPDGEGPSPAQLIVGGDREVFVGSNLLTSRIARFDGVSWHPLGAGLNGLCTAVTSWDPDGNGPLSPVVVASGDFTSAGGVPVSGIASWDGERWSPMGGYTDSLVWSLTSWDMDGPGPMPPQLIAAGAFTVIGGVNANSIARWDGERWWPLGGGLDRRATLVSTWDPDGDGPIAARLVVAGDFESAGGKLGSRLAWMSPVVPPCDADFDGDGFADFLDLNSFLVCFETGECPSCRTADMDRDGFVDFFDLDAFLAAFEEGC